MQGQSIMALLQETISGPALQAGEDLALIVNNTASGKGKLTAGSAGSIASNTPLMNAAINEVTTVAAANGSVELPPAIAGKWLFVINSAAANSMTAYAIPNNAATGAADVIEALAGGATVTTIAIPAAAVGLFVCATPGRWKSVFQ